MFQHVQLRPRLQDPAQFAQGGRHIRNRAQRECHQSSVRHIVIDGNAGPIETDEFDIDR